jgi:sterol desaturase/sphingolipid hydroxylase (fatty acid hydroxylase superfamily)
MPDMFKAQPMLQVVLPAMILLIIAEIIWSYRRRKKTYHLKEVTANLLILIGFRLSQLVFAGYQLYWFNLGFEFSLFELPKNPLTFLVTFLLLDFLYYWHHRAMHELKFFWAFHLVHHSSLWFNLTTAFRLNWFGALFGVFFYLPAALLGCPIQFIAMSLTLNLFFQFFLHTEAVGKLGFLEGVINTPSAHRVHHASNDCYLDKNYGGVLMIWDRVFGTYQSEQEPVRYGITTGFAGYNPVQLITQGFIDFARGKMNYKG